MTVWIWGRAKLTRQRASAGMPLDMLVSSLKPDRPARVAGTAIYMTAGVDNVPAALLHNMRHNKIFWPCS